MLKEIKALIQKDLLLDWRQRFSLASVILYLACTIFIVVIATQSNNPGLWNAVFWIVVLFVSSNAVAKSFIQESDRQRIYYYTLANPIAVLTSKYIYNTLILFVLSMIAFGLLTFFTINPVRLNGLFFLTLFLGATGFSIVFTFTSSIASAASNRNTLLAILSFPLLLPMLFTLLKLSQQSLGLITDTSYETDILILVAIDLLLVGVSFLLFPYLWKD
ncbi:MAG: heme exporter protein CcmB [Bacteroidia bacterium]|nr:heme exporter protein CcmB [Bacteroidia bacterium]